MSFAGLGSVSPLTVEIVQFVLAGLVLVCLAATVTFVVSYGLRSPWRSSTVGRATMWLWADMALVLILSTLTRVVQLPIEVRIWVALGVYVTLAFSLWRKVIVLLQVQRNPAAVEARDVARLLRAAEKADEDEKENE